MQKFEKEFCRAMFEGNEFTLRLEVHGNKNRMEHARTYFDNIDRPEEAEQETRRDRKRKRKRGGDN